ncbi:MAG: hypothetical protein ACYC0V_00625 [Armatimonadota bacterium]
MGYNVHRKTILLLSDDSKLVNSVNDVANRIGADVILSDTAIDLIGIPADLQIVDRTCTEQDDWDAYLDYLGLLDKPLGEELCGSCPELCDTSADQTPLIIVDNLPPIVADLSYLDPIKVEGSVFYISYSSTHEIAGLTERLLRKQDSAKPKRKGIPNDTQTWRENEIRPDIT